jgi:GTP cyclohydrolase IB
MEDVQNRNDTRNIPIDKVGIKNIRHPVLVNDRSGKQQHTVANFNMYVMLPHNFKGTHMSRFVEILNQHEDEITVQSFRQMLHQVSESLDADIGHIEMNFPFFVKKTAPISKVTSLMGYDVTFKGSVNNGKIEFWLKVVAAVTSLCPCSKKISDYGAHNQRSHVTVDVRADDFIWIEDIIDIIEEEASCEVFSLLKRPDEKVVTERAYDNPKFVEDMVRDVASRFNQHPKILQYVVEAENFESIHNHSAYALIASADS